MCVTWQWYCDWQTLGVHARGKPARTIPQLREPIARIDPALPLFGVTTMAAAVSSGFSTSRTAERMRRRHRAERRP
jgi:hypothetical protein